MGIEETDPHVIEGLVLMHAFLKIADATDRRKVIELAARLARASFRLYRPAEEAVPWHHAKAVPRRMGD